jgi:SpoVK/Ycf46/Vps4 family AAA+-type ATPase
MGESRIPFFGRPLDSRTGGGEPPSRSVSDAQEPSAAKVEHGQRFVARPPAHRLADVVLPPMVSESVEAVIAKLAHRRILYEEWGLRRIDPFGGKAVINFHGPPGTGKSMLAEGIAERLGLSIIEVNYAEIESRYVGDTPKNITAAFAAAREQGAAIFFDEADSILGKRMTHVTQASDHSVNVSRAVMLRQLDSHDGVVLFATNLARNIDGAFVRRILFHVEVPVPDEAGRQALFRKMLPPELAGRDTLDIEVLARDTDGLVGGEIKNIILIAATHAVQRHPPERAVRPDDMSRAIAHVKAARRDVGDFHGLGGGA